MTEPTSRPAGKNPAEMEATERAQPRHARTHFLNAVAKGFMIGAASVVLILPTMLYVTHRQPEGAPSVSAQVPSPPAPRAQPPSETQLPHIAQRANFRGQRVSADVKRIANWVADSGDNAAKSFVIVDKKGAKVFLFDPGGRLLASTPALLGAARGDDTVPGIGDKPLDQVRPEEKTTPAGRFIAEVGQSSSRGEDVVWVDYDAAVSMHRVIKVPERLKSLASPRADDNRMSFGCINLPDAFYEKALRPAVDRGAVIYVLPETRPLQATFAAFYDIDARQKLAQR